MARIRQKLHSRRGASILIAMLLVLVATLVSVVVIEASLTATRRARSERDYTQQTLYIQSAGELFKDCLKQTSVVVSRTSLDYDGGEDGAFDAYDDPGEIRYSCDGVLGDVMAQAVEEVETLDGDTTATAEKTVTVGGGRRARRDGALPDAQHGQPRHRRPYRPL